MDELFTSDISEPDELDQFSSSNNDTFTAETDLFQEAGYDTGSTIIELPEDEEQWGEEQFTIYYPPYAGESTITDGEGLFTSSPIELPETITNVGSDGVQQRGNNQAEDSSTQTTTEDIETKEILRAILNKIPEKKADEETTTTTEEETESTTDGYIYELSNIQSKLSEMQDRQEIGIKNNNLLGLSGIMLISALLGAIFINMLLGRMR